MEVHGNELVKGMAAGIVVARIRVPGLEAKFELFFEGRRCVV